MNTRKKTRLCQHCGGVNPLAASHCAYCSAGLVGYEELDSSAFQSAISVDSEPLDAKVLEASLYETPPKFSSHEASSNKAWVVGEDPLEMQETHSESENEEIERTQLARANKERPETAVKNAKPKMEEDLFTSMEANQASLQASQAPGTSSKSQAPAASLNQSEQQELPGMPISDINKQLPPLSSTALPQEVSQALSEGENARLLSRHEGLIFDESALSKKPVETAKQPHSSAASSELRPIYSVFDQPDVEKMGRLQQQVAKNETLIGSTYTQGDQGGSSPFKMMGDGAKALFTGDQGLVTLVNRFSKSITSSFFSMASALSPGWSFNSLKNGLTEKKDSSEYFGVAVLGLSLFGQLALLWAALLIFFSQDGQFTLSWSATTWPIFFAIGASALWLSLKMQSTRSSNLHQ